MIQLKNPHKTSTDLLRSLFFPDWCRNEEQLTILFSSNYSAPRILEKCYFLVFSRRVFSILIITLTSFFRQTTECMRSGNFTELQNFWTGNRKRI